MGGCVATAGSSRLVTPVARLLNPALLMISALKTGSPGGQRTAGSGRIPTRCFPRAAGRRLGRGSLVTAASPASIRAADRVTLARANSGSEQAGSELVTPTRG